MILLICFFLILDPVGAATSASDEGSLLAINHEQFEESSFLSLSHEHLESLDTGDEEVQNMNSFVDLEVAMEQMRQEAKSAQALRCSSAPLEELGMKIVTPQSPTYNESRKQWASMMGSQEESDNLLWPHLIIFCHTEKDVVEAIKYANMCGCRISIRSGGHQYAGLSSCEKGTNCVQLDVSSLEKFEYDEAEHLVTLGVGLDLQQVWAKLMPLKLTIPMGICHTVNIGGHLQSSSIGGLTRAEGLGMDHVQSFRIALADGTVHTVTRDSSLGCANDPCSPSERNLFWAALGGGPGSWGVILEYTVRPIKDSKYPYSALMTYVWPFHPKVYVEMVKKFIDVTTKNPKYERDLALMFKTAILPELMPIPQLKRVHKGNPAFQYMVLVGLWTGGDNGEMTESIQKETIEQITSVAEQFKLPALPLPKTGLVIRGPLGPLLESSNSYFDQLPGFRYHIHSFSHHKIMEPEFIQRSADEISKRIALGMYSEFDWLALGGAQQHGGRGSQLNRNDGLNAFPHRDMIMHADDWLFFKEDQAAVALQSQKDFRDNTKQFWEDEKSAERTYMTPFTLEPSPAVKLIEHFAHYFPTIDRMCELVRVKSVVDRDDLFHSGLTVPCNTTGNLFLYCNHQG